MIDPKHGGPVPPGVTGEVRRMLSDTPTPRTDQELFDGHDDAVPADFARTLERELAAAQARIAELESEISTTIAILNRTREAHKNRIAELEANQCEGEPVLWLDYAYELDDPKHIDGFKVRRHKRRDDEVPLYRKANR